MSAETTEQIYRRYLEEGWNGGNFAVLEEIVAPDFKDHANPPGFPSGLDGLKAVFTTLRTAFPDLKATIDDVTADGDKVWARTMQQGTHTGQLMGMAPTGRRMTMANIGIYRFSDGKMVEHWAVSDQLGMMQQLGLVTVPGLPAETGR